MVLFSASNSCVISESCELDVASCQCSVMSSESELVNRPMPITFAHSVWFKFFFFCRSKMLSRVCTRPLATLSRRIMSQSTPDFVSYLSSIISSFLVCMPATCTDTSSFDPLAFIVLTVNFGCNFRTKSSMPLYLRRTPRFRTLSTRRHGDSTLASSSSPPRCPILCQSH